MSIALSRKKACKLLKFAGLFRAEQTGKISNLLVEDLRLLYRVIVSKRHFSNLF
jgi:hypothetical protein